MRDWLLISFAVCTYIQLKVRKPYLKLIRVFRFGVAMLLPAKLEVLGAISRSDSVIVFFYQEFLSNRNTALLNLGSLKPKGHFLS